jgi:hypothetical protein
MHSFSATITLGAALLGVGSVLAQRRDQHQPAQETACPPGAEAGSPTVGSSREPLSERLAQSKGVLCPPAGVDPDMQVKPPGGGAIKVIPPPGTPEGDPNVQPK